ncbi:MAG: CPBP family glutamic-type intramembrane protease [SAR324 cluster bacterium]|nr:CPBP family glutamic-type intramembrane protease [SAR324 cluster bacterium]
MGLKTYLKESAHPFYGAITAMGMLIIYEIFLVWEPDLPVLYRNAPEAWMRNLLHFFGLSHHYVSFFWITIALVAVPLLHKKGLVFSNKIYFFITLEALFWGAVSGILIQTLISSLLMAQSGLTGHLLSDLALAIGAGLFEELFFRVGLTSLLILGLSQVFSWRLGATIVSIFVASFLFSLAHYTGNAGDSFTIYSFLFRFFAGFWFTTLYAVRGFSVVALTHAFYDIFIILG